MHKKWTDEEQKTAVNMRANRHTFVEIGATIGRTPKAVETRLRDLGAALYKRGGSRWSAAECKTLREFAATGLTILQISERIPGRSYRAVDGQIRRLRIKIVRSRSGIQPEAMVSLLRQRGWTCIEPTAYSGVMSL